MFDRLKQTANVAKFKADQMLHVQGVQNEINTINQQISIIKDQLAVVVLTLHNQRGTLGMPEVDDICVQIDALYAQIAQKQQQIEAIKAEQPPQAAPPAPPQPMAQPFAPQPPQQPYAAAPTPPLPPAAAAPQVRTCPTCHAAVPASASFCINCGTPLPK